jgi:hypothetical protein
MKAQPRTWLLLIGLGLYLTTITGQAQSALQVVTKVVAKELPYSAGQRVRLTAEKADISIHGWNRPVVSVRLRLTAKHPDRAVAEREVGYQQYTLQANGNEIELANSYAVPRGAGKVQSQLKAIYDISVPAGASLLLKNSFGDIQLTDLTGDTNLSFEFGKLSLEDVGGKTTVRSSYGDIDGRGVDGALLLTTEKADITLRDLAGRAVIKSRYGKLAVVPLPSLSSLAVEAARTEILLAPRRIGDFQYDVITTFADIRVPEAQQSELGKLGSKQTFTYQPTGRKPLIQIQSSYGNVTVQADKPIVDR